MLIIEVKKSGCIRICWKWEALNEEDTVIASKGGFSSEVKARLSLNRFLTTVQQFNYRIITKR